MTNALKINTNVGFGFAIQTDPFQSGREAAQVAKNSLGNRTPDLILALGPSNPQFQDFIEGVRLVTGESALLGLPFSQVWSRECVTPGGCAVLLISSQAQQFTMAAEGGHGKNPLADATLLLSQIREDRGSLRSQYDFEGFLTFQTAEPSLNDEIRFLWNELPLDNWFAGIRPALSTPAPIICRDKILTTGSVAISCLSNDPHGLGVVNASAFQSLPNIFREAAKTAFRDARNQMTDGRVSMALAFLNFEEEAISPADLDAFFKFAGETLGDVPVLAMPGAPSFLFAGQKGAVEPEKNGITVILFPD